MIMISSSVLIYHYKNFSIECLYFLSFLLGATFVSSPPLLLRSYYTVTITKELDIQYPLQPYYVPFNKYGQEE
jgi:hypothetical protein